MEASKIKTKFYIMIVFFDFLFYSNCLLFRLFGNTVLVFPIPVDIFLFLFLFLDFLLAGHLCSFGVFSFWNQSSAKR